MILGNVFEVWIDTCWPAVVSTASGWCECISSHAVWMQPVWNAMCPICSPGTVRHRWCHLDQHLLHSCTETVWFILLANGKVHIVLRLSCRRCRMKLFMPERNFSTYNESQCVSYLPIHAEMFNLCRALRCLMYFRSKISTLGLVYWFSISFWIQCAILVLVFKCYTYVFEHVKDFTVICAPFIFILNIEI